jgi:hypothetical protein
MATGDIFQRMTDWGGASLNIGMVFFVILILGGVIFYIRYLYVKWKRFQQYKVLVMYKDTFGNTAYMWDKAGVFINKNLNAKRFYLKKHGCSLSADDVPFIPYGKHRLVILQKISSKNFRFIKPSMADKLTFTVSEDDVNWAMEEYSVQKKRWTWSLLKEYLPFVMLFLGMVFIVILALSIIKKFDVIVLATENLKQTAEIQARTTQQILTGTRVITNGTIY